MVQWSGHHGNIFSHIYSRSGEGKGKRAENCMQYDSPSERQTVQVPSITHPSIHHRTHMKKYETWSCVHKCSLNQGENSMFNCLHQSLPLRKSCLSVCLSACSTNPCLHTTPHLSLQCIVCFAKENYIFSFPPFLKVMPPSLSNERRLVI